MRFCILASFLEIEGTTKLEANGGFFTQKLSQSSEKF